MKMERFTEKVLKNIGKLDSENISSVVRTLQNEAHIMETIFNHLPEGVIFLDSQMRIVLVNRAARDMLSLGENQSIEGKLDNLISEGELLRVLKQSLKQPDRIVQEEIYLTRPRERLVLINIYPLFDFKDERMGNILTFWDITEKDRNEKISTYRKTEKKKPKLKRQKKRCRMMKKSKEKMSIL
jgi:PAS domain S-box-containing protein